jgi:hypothetical protein
MIPAKPMNMIGISNMDRRRIRKACILIIDHLEQKKPYSAVTVAVENFTSEQWEEDDLSGIPDLVEGSY